jgi:hypothetical protein
MSTVSTAEELGMLWTTAVDSLVQIEILMRGPELSPRFRPGAMLRCYVSADELKRNIEEVTRAG